MDITGMTEIIRTLQRHVQDNEVREGIYACLLDHASEDSLAPFARACLGIDPLYDSALGKVEEAIKQQDAIAEVIVWFKGNPRNRDEPPTSTVLETAKANGALTGAGGGFVEGPRAGWLSFAFTVPKDKAEDLKAKLLAIDGVQADDPLTDGPAFTENAPEAPEFTPPTFNSEYTAPSTDAA